MSLNKALNKANDVVNYIKDIVNPDLIPNAEDVDFRETLKITNHFNKNNFNTYFGKGGGKSEIKNQTEKKYKGVTLDPYKKYNVCDNPISKKSGTKVFEGHKETYYSTKKFNIHKTACPVPGVHVVSSTNGGDGTVRDKDGYIVVAQNGPKFGTTIMTSLGPGKVYDRGGMKSDNHIDIFTDR